MSSIGLERARIDLAELVNRAAFSGERTTLTRRGRAVAAVISIEDLELLEWIEDEEDVKSAKRVLARIRSGQELVGPLPTQAPGLPTGLNPGPGDEARAWEHGEEEGS